VLDVHPPHESVHSWRDFFIHIATIVVGLIIAVGLEQTVEALHRHSERAELRESLQHETYEILRDAEHVDTSISAEIKWQQQIGDIFIASERTHRPLGQLPPEPLKDFDFPDDPIYKAAKASNKLTLLSKEETEAYGELDGLLEHVNIAYRQRVDALNAEIETQRQLRFDQPVGPIPDQSALNLSSGFAPYAASTLSSEDLKNLYTDTVHLEISAANFVYWSRQVRGAAVALHQGERHLNKIEAAERQFDNLP